MRVKFRVTPKRGAEGIGKRSWNLRYLPGVAKAAFDSGIVWKGTKLGIKYDASSRCKPRRRVRVRDRSCAGVRKV